MYIHVYTCMILYIESSYILHIYMYISAFLAYQNKYNIIHKSYTYKGGSAVGSACSLRRFW